METVERPEEPEETESAAPPAPGGEEQGTDRPVRGRILEGTVVDAGDREAVASTALGPVRVRGAVLGDRLRIRVVRAGQHAAWGRVEEILAPSPQRVVPRCGVIAFCGGCPWQAWDPAAQREEKRRRVEAELRGLGPVEVEPVASAPDVYGFRNKLLLAAGGRPGKLRFGLYAPRTHRLVPAEECPVQDPEGNRIVGALARVLNSFGIPPFDELLGTGLLRHILVRIAPGTGQAGVVLAAKSWPLPRVGEIAKRILDIPGVLSVYGGPHEEQGPAAKAAPPALLSGRPRLLARAGSARILLTPSTFFQTNSPALPLLVDAVREALPKRIAHLADLYSGAGLFTLSFAKKASKVTAVDEDPGAIRDLAESVRMQEFHHVAAVAADAARAEIEGTKPDVVILDPPRAGIPAGLARRLVEEWRPARIIHVSCSVKALARDLAMLSSRGYRILKVQPIDLFPHTPHIEVVASLERA